MIEVLQCPFLLGYEYAISLHPCYQSMISKYGKTYYFALPYY